MTKKQKDDRSLLIPYMRKSSGEDPTLSLERQRQAIQRWAAQNDVELAPEVWEPGVSGAKSWRERGLGEAIARVGRGDAAGIIVEEQSRLSRANQLQTAEVWEELQRANARLVATADGIDTSKRDEELNFSIRAALARDQWKQSKRRSDAVKENRTAAGIMIGPAPTGYTKDDDGRLVPDAFAPYVHHLFEMRAAGNSWSALRRYFNEATGREWTQQGISGMIRNRTYTGKIHYGDLVAETEHEAIVDSPLWNAAQRKGKSWPKSGPKSTWLLSGRLICGSCGHVMIGWRGANERTITLADGTKERRKQARDLRYMCKNVKDKHPVSVRAPAVEQWLLTSLWQLLGSRVSERHDGPDLRPLEAAVEQAQQRVEQVMADGAADDLGDLWAPEVRRRREALEAAEAALGEARLAAGQSETVVTDFKERWPDLSFDERREALEFYGVHARCRGKTPDTWELILP